MSFSSPHTRSSSCWCKSSPLILGLRQQISQKESLRVWPTAFTPSSTYGRPARNGGTGPASLSGTFAGGRGSFHHVSCFFLPSSTAGLLWALPRGSWFSCAHTAGAAGLISPKVFGTFPAEMETPFLLRISLIIEFIIELGIEVQIGSQNHAKYTAYAFRTVWTLLSEVVGKYWL